MSKHIRGTSTGADLLMAVDKAISGEVADELLAALKGVVDLLENGSDGWSARDYGILVGNVLGDAQAAIAKAEEVK